MIRIIEFDDGVRWVARLRMPPLNDSGLNAKSPETIEFAFAAPWEIFADFPLTLTVIPAALGPSHFFDERGDPVSSELAQNLAD
jgi:hypothetical protein